MPKSTVRANAQALPETEPATPADIQALAAKFEASWRAERALDRAAVKDIDKAAAKANRRTERIVDEILAQQGADLSLMRLKARAYMWSEGATDLEEFDNVQHDSVSGPVLVSLFRDLGVDRPDKIKCAVEARRRTLEASLALATNDEKDRIASDIAACESLLRRLDASAEAAQ